ncbi:MAG TPA: response regulator [Gemmatimonadales bacterium]|nr:response regulator [Gemmatimonadales bacterium]
MAARGCGRCTHLPRLLCSCTTGEARPLATVALLLVEDDEFVRLALTRALNRTGVFTVTPAEHGARALELLAEQRVDAILTDLQMPVMDGLALLGGLLERGIRTPVAVMTGQRITPELADRLHAYGIAAAFSKPVDISALADELQRSLSPATVGRIMGVTLFGFLQLLEVERKTGLIVVSSSGEEGRLYFDRGALVHGETRRLRGVAAVHEIVGWPDPKLEIFYKRTSRERTIEVPLQHLLMEAARLLDERGRSPGGAEDDEGADRGGSTEDAGTTSAVRSSLEEAMQIEGALGVALVDGASGMSLGTAGGSANLNVELAGAGAADFVRAKLRVLAALGMKDTIEDVMITLGKQYYLIRFLGPELNVFLYLVLDRERSNLGMARHRLATIARRITL